MVEQTNKRTNEQMNETKKTHDYRKNKKRLGVKNIGSRKGITMARKANVADGRCNTGMSLV